VLAGAVAAPEPPLAARSPTFVALSVRDLDATVKRLAEKGARFEGRLFSDETTGVRSHLLLDNEDKVIQLFEELKAPPAKR
jgi:hypothetical protein